MSRLSNNTLIATAVVVAIVACLAKCDLLRMATSPSKGFSNGQPQPGHPQVAALKSFQGVLAASIYAGAVVACSAAAPPMIARVLVLPAIPLMMVAYNLLSFNGAGGYYNTHCQMITKLKQHGEDIERRETAVSLAHQEGLAREREQGIYRFVNGLEAVVVWTLVALVGMIAGFFLDFEPTAIVLQQAVAVAVLVLAINFAWFGLPYQWPEALWQLSANSSAFFKLSPLTQHPDPSY